MSNVFIVCVQLYSSFGSWMEHIKVKINMNPDILQALFLMDSLEDDHMIHCKWIIFYQCLTLSSLTLHEY